MEVYDLNPVVVPAFLKQQECERLIQEFRHGEKVSGELRPDVRKDSNADNDNPVSKFIRNNTVCWLNRTESTTWIYARVCDLMNQMNEKIYKFDLVDLQPIQLAEYKASQESGGEFYRSHLDICTRGINSQRKLSLSVQLSGSDEYEGGDLLLFGDQNDIVLDQANLEMNLFHRRQLGAAILFPSFYEHEITPVTKGTRYSLVAWMEGPNWK